LVFIHNHYTYHFFSQNHGHQAHIRDIDAFLASNKEKSDRLYTQERHAAALRAKTETYEADLDRVVQVQVQDEVRMRECVVCVVIAFACVYVCAE
jgi:hypothetical protein